MSAGDRRDDKARRTVLRTPNSGVGRPEEVRTSVSTTQSSGGLAAGDPAGGPQRTPERRAIDEESGRGPAVRSGRDRDAADTTVSAPEDVNATPPHGDILDSDIGEER